MSLFKPSKCKVTPSLCVSYACLIQLFHHPTNQTIWGSNYGDSPSKKWCRPLGLAHDLELTEPFRLNPHRHDEHLAELGWTRELGKQQLMGPLVALQQGVARQ